MDNDPPQTRINQYFSARKKKTQSPSAKFGKSSEIPNNVLPGSPNSKCIPDGCSPVEHTQQKQEEKVGSQPHGHANRNLALEPNQEFSLPQKTNTRHDSFFEDPTSVPMDAKAIQHGVLSHLEGKETNAREGTLLKCSPIKRTSEIHHTQRQDGGFPARTMNLELRDFTTDLISLYFSNASSTDADQSLTVETVGGLKRNVSPSLLNVNSNAYKKKPCIKNKLHQTVCVNECTFEAESQHAEKAPGQLSEELVEQFSRPDHAQVSCFQKNSGNEVLSTASSFPMRKCDGAQEKMTETGSHPACTAFVNTADIRETPCRSVRSSTGSMFSPGEEFWNEAIQFADIALAPKDSSPVQVPHTLIVANEESDKLSVQKFASHDSYTVQNVHTVTHSLCGSTKWTDKDIQTNANLLITDKSEGHHAENSPLPVKHFDFSNDENDLDAKLLQHGSPKIHHDIVLRIHKVPGSDSSNNPDSVPKVSQLSNSRIERNHKNSDPLAKNVLLGVSVETEGVPQARQNIHGTCLATLKEEHSGGTGDKFGKLSDEYSTYEAGNERNGHRMPIDNCHASDTPSSLLLPEKVREVSEWLPSEVSGVYLRKGISKLYPWQVQCLQTEGVLQKRNLVYCASTSAGKSFVAEILMLRQVLSTGKMALLVLPYVSLCAEKAEHLETLLGPLNKHVRSFYGNQGSGTLPKDTSIAVCTIEKANSLINRLLEESRLSEVGIVVIDELHMVGDQSRGYLLELMLTKLRYATGEGISDTSSGEKSSSSNGNPAYGLQIVGMSATMPNVAAVADWLQAALYQTDFRPVPLEEYIKIGSTIFDKNLNTVRMIPKQADLGGKDPEHVVELCNEVVQEGHSVLIFCSSRRGCETTAKHVSKYLKKFGVNVQDGNYELKETLPALEALRKCSSGLDPILEETLPAGVAYHHAGLTVEEREIVESCYRQGIVRVLTATSTLAAGVNLPARRVIFRQPRIGRDFIDGVRYKQMAGRAGRTGIDSKGESMMLCKPEESKRTVALLNNSCEPLQSCLSDDKNGMTHAILEVVTAGLVQTANDIHRYVRCTLLNTTKPFKDVVKSAQDSLQWLCRQHFLAWNDETKLYTATPLGRAAFGSSLTPEESLIVLADLSRAREGFVLASDLHLVYLVTPININVELDWELYYERFMELSPLDQSVGNRIGVAEPFLMGMAHGAHTHPDAAHRGNPKVQHHVSGNISLVLSDAQVLRVSRRLYVSLMLCKLVQEIPVMAVCEAFKVSRGMVQGLQENAGRFASMVCTFCERLGWQDMAGLISKFQHRVSFGVRAEIVELTNIPFVKGSRARALYKAGLRTPQSVAEASISEIAKALFEASSWDAQATGLQRVQVGVAKKIKSGARKIVIEQAEEARLAAFSALRSLGFSVPQLSKPLVSSAVADVIDEEAAIIKDDASLMPVILENDNIDSGAAKAIHSFDQSGVGNVHLHVPTPASDLRQDSQLQGTNKINTVMDSILSKDIKMDDGNVQDTIVNVFSGSGFAKFETSLTSNSLVSSNEMSSSHGKSMDELILKGPLGQRTDCCRLKCSISDGGPINTTSLCGGIDSFLSLWGEADHFYFDLHFTKVSEPTSTVPFEIQGIAVCWNGSPVYYVNISKDLVSSKKVSCSSCSLGETNRNSNSSITSEGMWELLKNRWNKISFIMERSGVKKVGWNLKCHLHVLKKPGICAKRISGLNIEHTELENHVKVVDDSYFLLPSIFLQDGIDASIVPWLLWPDEESFSCPNLGKVVQKRLSVEAVSSACRDGRWRNQMHRVAHNGCCHRVAQTRALYFQLWKLLVSEELVDVLYDIENRLVNVIADMEIWGIGVDMNSCHRARKILGKKLKCLEEEACKLAGMYFSLHNAADVANILYNQLKLPIPGRSNKMKLHPSTDKQSLEFLRDLHPIVPVIKEHRTLTKLFNTLGSICSLARLCVRSKKYKIHGRWLQTSAATGRLSMEEPNLQCVEHIIEFKLPSNGKSSAEYELHQINAREFFIPTQDDWIILAADYSQIELRLMAHFSKDPSLIEFLSNPDGDVFIMIAAKWTGKMLSTITNKEREQTKRLVYGILYGMGLHTLAEHLECSIEEAGEKFHTFMTSFPGVSSWLTKVVQICHKNGYIQTLKGRKRFLPKINSQDIKEKAKAQRQAVNSICQGSAADIIKIAMIKIYSVISEGCLASSLDDSFAHEYGILKGRCHIILQVHDELILEVDPSVLNEAALLLRKSMEEAVSLNVPLPVKLKAGRTWGSLEPFAIDPGKNEPTRSGV